MGPAHFKKIFLLDGLYVGCQVKGTISFDDMFKVIHIQEVNLKKITGLYLTYNVVLALSLQQNESYIYVILYTLNMYYI